MLSKHSTTEQYPILVGVCVSLRVRVCARARVHARARACRFEFGTLGSKIYEEKVKRRSEN